MFKKIALCAMLVLILIPASVMAAGMQGQGSGSGNGAGSGIQSQSQTAIDSTSGEAPINGHGQRSGMASEGVNAQMARSGSCNGTCDQDMVRNMTRSQDQDMIRNMTQDRIQNMTRSQLRLGYESVLAGEGQGPGAGAGNGSGNGSGVLQQEGQISHLQYQFSNMNRAQFGLTNVNGRLILASAADASGDQDRVMGRDILRTQTRLQDGSCGNCTNL